MSDRRRVGGTGCGRRCHPPAYANIPRETIARLKHYKAICRYGIGVDIVDIRAAYEHGMVVTSVPDYCLGEVADHTTSMGFTPSGR